LTREERKQKKYDETHKIIDGVLYKKCSSCDEWYILNEDNFYKHKTSSDGFHPYCKECNIIKSYLWTRSHLDRYNESNKRHKETQKFKDNRKKISQRQRDDGYCNEYYSLNKNKFKEYGEKHRKHEISSKEWKLNKDYFKNKDGEWCCAYCGITETEHKKLYNQQLQKDHVQYDGKNDLSNCVPACKPCNSSKKQYDIEEWYRQQEFFSEERLNKIYKWIKEDYKQYIKITE